MRNLDPKTVDLPSPLLRMTGIRKSFPGVVAVSSGSFELLEGEIHALVGENGAGKSTLVKVLTGVYHADDGEIRLLGKPALFNLPLEAQRAGIATIYQEFTLVPALTVHANLFLGRERTKRGLIDFNFEKETASSLLEKLGVEIDPESRVVDLGIAHQQLVEITRALAADAKILVMDEPTAALAPREVESLFAILKDLKRRGIGILFISHRLDEVFSIADRVTVMRDGETIGTWKRDEITRKQLIAHMVGRPLEEEYPKTRAALGETRFEVRNLTGGLIKDASFSAKRGEVLGLAGLMGAGRTELARLIFGADSKERGQILLDGEFLRINSPRDAIGHGICLLTEDRKLQGIILKATAKENFALPNLISWSHLGFINHKVEKSRFAYRAESLKIRVASPDQPAEDLSGGNQQKLLVARWLETNFQVIIFDEPTRGIDVGAKYEMYLLINDLAASGKVVIVISSDLLEVLGISHRILVMREGQIAGEIVDVSKATQEDVMALAIS
ncbi:MAG: sugar ABC transporter ATP-binding protein [Candidatus Zixiibacteriota bacterium]